MKLQELAINHPVKNVAKVFESSFGRRFDIEKLGTDRATQMLSKVSALIREHRASPSFHYSERNPDYLKLMMMEQSLRSYIQEMQGQVVAVDVNDPKIKAMLDKASRGQNLTPDEQKTMAAVAAMKKEGKDKKKSVMESEVQQAQVIMAAQDLVDRVQKMLEQASEMQFKDLPAIVDSMKYDVGTEQAAQFQADSTAALTQLVQSLQQSKTQLDSALGVITGTAPMAPAIDATGDMSAMDGDIDADAEIDVDTDVADQDEELAAVDRGLGRERR